MTHIHCFLIKPTNRYAQLLRRFGSSNNCPHQTLHDAHALLDTGPEDGFSNGDNHPHDDPAWPTAYSCGCPIPDTDMWQACRDTIWRADDGREFLLDLDLPGISIAPPEHVEIPLVRGPGGLGRTRRPCLYRPHARRGLGHRCPLLQWLQMDPGPEHHPSSPSNHPSWRVEIRMATGSITASLPMASSSL